MRDEDILLEVQREIRAFGTDYHRRNGEQERRLDRLEDVLDRVTAGGGRTFSTGSPEDRTRSPRAHRAFGAYLRGDHLPEEQRALLVGDDAHGGLLVPAEIEAEIGADLPASVPLRRLARVVSISAPELRWPYRKSPPNAAWRGEQSAVDVSDAEWGSSTLSVLELASAVVISRRLLEDSELIVPEVVSMLTDEFAKAESAAFTVGDGVQKPRGILTYPDGPGRFEVEQVASGAAADITLDGLLAMWAALPSSYAAAASWLMNRRTLARLRGMRDGEGRMIWGQIADASAGTLLGAAVVEADDMPDIAPGATPIALGAWRAAYMIADRAGIQTLTDAVSRAAKGMTVLHAWKRVGGALRDGRAAKLMKIAAA